MRLLMCNHMRKFESIKKRSLSSQKNVCNEVISRLNTVISWKVVIFINLIKNQ